MPNNSQTGGVSAYLTAELSCEASWQVMMSHFPQQYLSSPVPAFSETVSPEVQSDALPAHPVFIQGQHREDFPLIKILI